MNVGELLKRQEGKTLEFKRDLTSPRNILKTLVAFANNAGGVILIGIDGKTREIIGIEDVLDAEERLCNLIADGIEPRLLPNIEIIAWEERNMLPVEVFPSPLKPHWLKKEGSDGVVVRLGSTNRQADAELIAELRRQASGLSFDEQPIPELDAGVIDHEAVVSAFHGLRRITRRELESLRLLVRLQGRLVPTVGGVLLFGKDREQSFPDAWVQCGRFAGKDKAHIFDHTEIHEHLPTVVDRIMEFLQKHAMRGADLSQLRRKDVWSIPFTILREAVINAVVHADYAQKGAPIRVAFFDDRIEIENPGILLPGLTIDDIRQGISRLRNRVIARVFKELGLIEQWGSGIRRMFSEAERLGLPEPQIDEIGMRYRFTVFLKESLIAKVTGEVTGEVKRLLAVCRGEMSRKHLQDSLGLKGEENFRRLYLVPALESGLLEMTIPNRPKSRLQRYRLTPKGRAVLAGKES